MALVFVAGLLPTAHLAWAYFTHQLSANPLDDLTDVTGTWTLRFLILTLSCTPIRMIFRWNDAVRFRRRLGLFAFFYGTLHFLTWAILDRYISLDFPDGALSWSAVRTFAASVGEDIYKRKFITAGFAAFVAMWPLAITSTTGMIRRLGGRRWQRLHRLIYFSAVAAVIHYTWLVKSDIRRPMTYGLIVAILLGFRLYWARRSIDA